MSAAEQERDAALAELRRVVDRLRIDGADVADAHADCARYATELIAAALNAVPTVPEHEDPARLRGQLADAHADCARYAAERDAARAERDQLADALLAAYLQLPDETRGGAQ